MEVTRLQCLDNVPEWRMEKLPMTHNWIDKAYSDCILYSAELTLKGYTKECAWRKWIRT